MVFHHSINEVIILRFKLTAVSWAGNGDVVRLLVVPPLRSSLEVAGSLQLQVGSTGPRASKEPAARSLPAQFLTLEDVNVRDCPKTGYFAAVVVGVLSEAV